MSKSETNILKLPKNQRPKHSLAPDLPHKNRSTFEAKYSARRISDPVSGMRAVIIHLLNKNHDFEQMPMHHVVPSLNQHGYGKQSFSLINESNAIPALNTLSAHPELEFGLTDPYQWSVSIGISISDTQNLQDQWQLETTAQLVKQCWRRYAHLNYVVDASILGHYASGQLNKLFPWVKLFALIVQKQ